MAFCTDPAPLLQAKLKEAEDAAAELALKLDIALEEKRQLEQRVHEFTQTLAERDELIAQLRAGKQVQPPSSPYPKPPAFRTHASCLGLVSPLAPCLMPEGLCCPFLGPASHM